MLIIMPYFDYATAAEKKIDSFAMLDAAEGVYRNMQQGNYSSLWQGLSARTRINIVRSVYDVERKNKTRITENDIRVDFECAGLISREYWVGYLSRFDPKSVLHESRWSMGEVRKDSAVILLRYQKSENDAHLKMFYEAGEWKVGLYESFSSRQ
jgi:hypothetical protein